MSRFWLLLGVEDTVEVKQMVEKGQKNEDNNENNSFVRRSAIVTYPVSSTPRRSLVWIIGLKYWSLTRRQSLERYKYSNK